MMTEIQMADTVEGVVEHLLGLAAATAAVAGVDDESESACVCALASDVLRGEVERLRDVLGELEVGAAIERDAAERRKREAAEE